MEVCPLGPYTRSQQLRDGSFQNYLYGSTFCSGGKFVQDMNGNSNFPRVDKPFFPNICKLHNLQDPLDLMVVVWRAPFCNITVTWKLIYTIMWLDHFDLALIDEIWKQKSMRYKMWLWILFLLFDISFMQSRISEKEKRKKRKKREAIMKHKLWCNSFCVMRHFKSSFASNTQKKNHFHYAMVLCQQGKPILFSCIQTGLEPSILGVLLW